MKNKSNAKQRREADSRKRMELWSPKKAVPESKPTVKVPQKPAVMKASDLPQQTPEEETREFLEYLERYNGPVRKDDMPQPARRKGNAGTVIGILNLEDGMPPAEDAVSRMNTGLQEMRVSQVKAVKLIHGYGSTGRGGKICVYVRRELAELKRKKLIRDFIPGEDFGPMNEASRKLAEQMKSITRDPDYGRMNHGITMVVL